MYSRDNRGMEYRNLDRDNFKLSVSINLRSVVSFTCAATEKGTNDNIKMMTRKLDFKQKNYNNCTLRSYEVQNLGQFQLQPMSDSKQLVEVISSPALRESTKGIK